MSIRDLIDPDCGGANPLMRLGNQIVHDVAHKDEGISGRPMPFAEASSRSQQSFGELSQNHLVNEFLGQMSAPAPQTFRMDALLQEMREIDAQNYPLEVVQAPTVSHEVHNGLNWANEFHDGAANVPITHASLHSKQAPIEASHEEQVERIHIHHEMTNISLFFLCFFFFGFEIVLAKSSSFHASNTSKHSKHF